jgi:hypothetical protein
LSGQIVRAVSRAKSIEIILLAQPHAALDRQAALINPEKFLEPMRRQGGIARRILNIAMPEIRLDRARVVAIVGELVAAGMPKSKRPSE